MRRDEPSSGTLWKSDSALCPLPCLGSPWSVLVHTLARKRVHIAVFSSFREQWLDRLRKAHASGPISFSFLHYRFTPKPSRTLFLTVSSPSERFYCTKHFMTIRFHESTRGLRVSLADMKPKFHQFQCGSAP